MTPDTRDTIVAVASARAPGARGIVRLAGPDSLRIVELLCSAPVSVASAQHVGGCTLAVEVDGAERGVACDLLLWPDERSYTHQPAAEVHTIGSPPVLDAIVRACLTGGARLAEPGEFTLRAFLAGRLDLTQAEAVLAVIDANHERLLAPALKQLAGGLSGPLHQLREELLDLLADLEAGLDFVDEEDVRFIAPTELIDRIASAQRVVAEAESQTRSRDTKRTVPRVAIVGPPNVGKSRLFNALVSRFGDEQHAGALVADQPGVTRDHLVAGVTLAGVPCELVDTAGVGIENAVDSIDRVARDRVGESREQADLLLDCRPANDLNFEEPSEGSLRVATMADVAMSKPMPSDALATSAATGEGLSDLAEAIAIRLGNATRATDAVADTAARCAASLASARESLARAEGLANQAGGEELVSFELREALDSLGRVVGAVVTDDILDQVFGKFCIGK